jgi:hypothetical protein
MPSKGGEIDAGEAMSGPASREQRVAHAPVHVACQNPGQDGGKGRRSSRRKTRRRQESAATEFKIGSSTLRRHLPKRGIDSDDSFTSPPTDLAADLSALSCCKSIPMADSVGGLPLKEKFGAIRLVAR